MNQLIISIRHSWKLPWYRRLWYWLSNRRLTWVTVTLQKGVGQIVVFSGVIRYTDSHLIVDTPQPIESATDISHRLNPTLSGLSVLVEPPIWCFPDNRYCPYLSGVKRKLVKCRKSCKVRKEVSKC